MLTPLAFDPGRPFPHISNLSLNLAVLLRDDQGAAALRPRQGADTRSRDWCRCRRPGASAPPTAPARYDFVWLEQLIAANLDELFPGMAILGVYAFRVTRDAEMTIQELEADDLLETIEEGVRRRRFGSVVRLTVDSATPAERAPRSCSTTSRSSPKA